MCMRLHFHVLLLGQNGTRSDDTNDAQLIVMISHMELRFRK